MGVLIKCYIISFKENSSRQSGMLLSFYYATYTQNNNKMDHKAIKRTEKINVNNFSMKQILFVVFGMSLIYKFINIF